MAEGRSSKIKKKKWLDLIAPKSFGSRVIGQTYVYESSTMKDKSMQVNLMSLTNDPKKQNTKVGLVVDEVKEDKAYTSIVSYKLVPASIKRLARRDRNKIDSSFVCKTKDDKIIRIKPLIITRAKTKGSSLRGLSNQVEISLRSLVKKTNYEGVIDALIYKKFQKELKNKLKNIYPLRVCDIREMSLVVGKKAEKAEKMLAGIKIVEEPEEVKEEKKPTKEVSKKEVPKEPAKDEPVNKEIPKAPESPNDSEDF